MKKHVLALVAVLALPATAQAAPPAPFAHACTPQNGTLFCPTAGDAQRVPSFDGVPIDVDVTLPPTGDGPFPALVMMHGWAGNKTNYQSASAAANGGYNTLRYAQQGYAVVTPSARGFGRSCGALDSRTSPGCDRGWVRLSDQRYDIRDTQHLLGLLVDQGVVKARAIGITGVSYGGIQTLNLARLRDRVRLPDGSFAPWRSPQGRRLRVAAAFARWPASDLASALQPNGRYLDFRPYEAGQSIEPGGVEKKSWNDLLYGAGNATGFYAADGGPFSADITGWKALTGRGEPVRADALAVGRELTRYHSAAGLSGAGAPVLLQNGWTDDLFPAPEALRYYRAVERAKGAHVALQLGDFGHWRGQNKQAVDAVLNAEGARFLDSFVKGRGKPPRHRSVVAFTQTCPATAQAGGPFRAASWDKLHPDTVRIGATRVQRISSDGGSAEVAKVLDPIGGGGACATVPAQRAAGTAVVERRVAKPFTLLGLPTVRATIDTDGRGGMIAGRLWDVESGRQTLVARGIYRLKDNQKGRVVFQLAGNGWRFAKGHRMKLELLGRDPNFVRTSNFRFSVKARGITATLPGR